MPRIQSVVEGTWGRATIYDVDKAESVMGPTAGKKKRGIRKEESKASKQAIHSHVEITDIVSSIRMSTIDGNESRSTLSEPSLGELSYLQSSLFGSILEDVITQLRILVECNNELRILKAKSDWPDLLRVKFGVRQPAVIDELDGIDINKLACEQYKINKLESDRNYINEVITATYVDLSLYRGYKSLEDYIMAVVNRDEYRLNLAEDEAKNKILLRDLKKQLRQQRNHIKSVIYETNSRIEALKTEVEDAVLVTECRGRFVDNWQRARTEQHIQTISDKETVYSESLEYYKQRTEHEQRVHMEVEMLINIKINEILQKVEDWMAKYDKDLEAIDLKIQLKKNDYHDMLVKRIDLENTIELHEKAMKDWIQFKDEREKARLYVEKMNKSAIIVQAWWRGMLVRRELGPFKVTKKGKKGKGKK